MLPLYLWVLVGVAVITLVAYLLNHYLDLGWNTSKAVLISFALTGGLALAPTTAWAGFELGKRDALTYNEFWNGVEVSVSTTKDTCERDGSCSRTWSCDPYPVTEVYTDSDGKTQTRTRTEYHDCPYVDVEYTYTVHTTLGDIVVGQDWFPANPQQHRWRADVPGLPNVPSGIPAAYTAAEKRLAAGEPAGVTKPAQYKNYFLASNDPVLSRYSDAMESYRDANLLPDTARPADMMRSNKVHVVGTLPPGTDQQDWDETLARLNGALGIELQGDLHLVIVTDDQVENPDEYASALRAHWWTEEMGKDAFAKNGIAVILGSSPNSDTVEWARAFTGMPEGNRALETELGAELPGTAFTPEAAIGTPQVTNVGSSDPVFAHSDGRIDQILWGTNAYQRICMGCDDADDTGNGYVYLESNVDAPTGAKVATVIIGWLLSAGLLAGLLALFPMAGAAVSAPFDRRRRYATPFRY